MQHELGYRYLSLSVFQHNHHAKQCYESLGFKVVSEQHAIQAPNNATWSAYEMVREIGSKGE
ncbi:hypothetical protein [Thaumasiovibrio sp. DFM-14]|uniref:hypothetical protein n=1 Tax=Thaumasiovibrio sp. DFM-14 TaxID=3384792 RepID=UPI0039A1F658